jgi:hypothetical protein
VFERDVDFAAAPDVFPPDNFNAGIMLLKPDKVEVSNVCSYIVFRLMQRPWTLLHHVNAYHFTSW